MNTTHFKHLIEEILKSDNRLWNQDKTELNQTLLIDLAEHYDEKILELLFQEETLKEKFFVKVNDIFVFKSNDFKFFLEDNKLNNSYTQYKNRIGLTDGKRFLKDTNDVVLDFPFKDCVLEGGQSTEEGNDNEAVWNDKTKTYELKHAKRKEIFFNSVLAHDEIDRLKDAKALINWNRFTKNGEQQVSEIKRNQDGTIVENMIIKGNNLLALHSLKKQFKGKIKLIYIDPPYNTGGDANIFTYNNSFNHSTWLTFMKNRLEVARELLKNDGFIAIAIDHFELGYLLVLADEIFGKENRLGIVTVVHNPEGRQNAKYFTATNEFMIVYRKSINSNFNSVYLQENFKESKNIEDVFNFKDDKGLFKEEDFIRLGGGNACLRKNKPNGWYPLYVSPDLKHIQLNKNDNYFEVFPVTDSGQERTWKIISKSFVDKYNSGDIYAKIENNKVKIFEKYRIDKGSPITTCWINKKYNAKSNGTSLLEDLFDSKLFSYPKSLFTVLDTLKIMTSDDDIILDFHGGSGTTGHATLALNKEDGGNRKFILVEQLEEHISICKERNQKVLAQENIDDSFLYFELAPWNETAKEQILSKNNIEELETFFEEMYERYFLNYNLKIKEFKEKVLKEENFRKMSLENQKKIFIAMLDNNQLYVNKTEMEDAKYQIKEEDIKLTRSFYKNEN